MAEEKALIIEAPRQGIAQNPCVGYGNVRNLDIFEHPGLARLNNLLAKKSATTVDAFVKWFQRDPDTPANIFALDSNGVLYKSANSGSTWAEVSDRSGTGQGMIINWGYVFVINTTTIDVMKISDSSWTAGWQTIDSDTLWHPCLNSDNDGKIYGGAGRYIFSIEEDTTFDPSDGGTFTFTQQALDLWYGFRVKSLEELGSELMCGTWKGTTITDFKEANIFPWDRVSPSFRKPIKIAEHGVNAMLTMGGHIIVLAGVGGTVYRCDGYQAYPVAQIPDYVCDLDGGKYLEPYPGALINYKGRPFFGVNGNVAIDGSGVYSLMQTSGGTITAFEHKISTGAMGSANVVQIGALLGISRDELLVGWRDDATYGIDLTLNTSRVTAYGGYFESPLYIVGSDREKRTFNGCEWQLARKLAANEGIRLRFRENFTDSYTTIGTYDYATVGDIEKLVIPELNIPPCVLLQIEVALTGTTTTPQFKRVILS